MGFKLITNLYIRSSPPSDLCVVVCEIEMASDGNTERLAANQILDKSDPTRLSSREIRDSYGSSTNFFQSHGLKPWNPSDCQQAVEISREMKSNQRAAAQQQK